MRKPELFQEVLHILENKFPQAETELQYNNPFELLVAVVLSCHKSRYKCIS